MIDFDTTNYDWLNDAIPLEVYRSDSPRLRRLVNRLFDEITPLIKVSSKPRQKEALKTVLINLFQAHQLDKPVRYSRDKNRYKRDRRYGQLFFKYDRLLPVIDALEYLDLIEQKTGYFRLDVSEGKQSRMWGTHRLWAFFHEYRLVLPGFFKPLVNPEDVIILRDESKSDIGYRETPQTRQMRDDLEHYNVFVRKHRISLRLDGDTLVDNRFIVEDIHRHIVNEKIWLKEVRLNGDMYWDHKPTPIPNFLHHLKKFTYNPKFIINNLLDRYYHLPTITHTNRAVALLRVQLRRFWSDEHRLEKFIVKRSAEIREVPWEPRKELLAEKFPLQEIGVEVLEIVLDQEELHRIFNLRSWKLGGRAYGALHEDWVRREMRSHILIDGEATTEIDYSGFHILMLYHLAGINYPDDPYSVCEGPEMRGTYKAVGLIAINAETPKKAYGGIRDELAKRGIPLPACREPLKSLVKIFREAHKTIQHHLFSGVGRTLQNIDSHIMNAILARLLDNGILGLPVYDSVIVVRRHADFTKEVMTEEYEKALGFKPRF